jgi:cysteine desulfurase/selenocysteine lyase
MIYLDNAATSWPKPRRVLDEMTRFLAEEGGSPSRAGHQFAAAAERIVQDVRIKLARMFKVENPDRIVHCFNCTDALNMAIKGCLKEGDHVVTTALEHNSISRPLQAMVDTGLITVTRLPLTSQGFVEPDAVRAAITPKTRLVATLHASNVTGIIQPVEAIGRVTRECDCLFLVDAAQSAGVLEIDVQAMNIDLLAFPGHKALLGPTGTGALCVGPRAQLTPWREGGTGADSVHPTQPQQLPTWLEAGTQNTVGLAGLNVALDGLQPEQTLAHERRLIERLLGAILDDPRIRAVGDPTPARCLGVISFTVAGKSPFEVAACLDNSFSIAVRPGLHCAPYLHRELGTFPEGTVRASLGPTTTESEIDTFAVALGEIAAG